uniref:Uncharacterized protein n=1 Tax=Pavo cristatus TaxID=9049 RepID=A0A8C9EZ47_PAVCR
MGRGGCTKCIKYLLFVFNFIFWVSPRAVGAVGLRVLLEPGFFHSFPPHQPAPMLSFAPCNQGFGRRGAFILCYFLCVQTQLYLFMHLFIRYVYIDSRRWMYFYVYESSAQGRRLGLLSSPRRAVFRLLRAGWGEPPRAEGMRKGNTRSIFLPFMASGACPPKCCPGLASQQLIPGAASCTNAFYEAGRLWGGQTTGLMAFRPFQFSISRSRGEL